MIRTGWLTAGGIFIASLCVVLAVVTATERVLRALAARRTARLVTPVRPLVLRVAAGADDDGAAMRSLRALDARTWAAVEPLVVTTLGKVRGDARSHLVSLLEAHGAGNRALDAAHSSRMTARARAAETLGVLREPQYLPALLRLLDDGSPDVRHVAARALGSIGDPAAAAPLLGVLDGSNGVPAQTVAQALIRLGSGTGPALIAALESRIPAIRAVATDVLGMHQVVAAVHPLIRVLTEDPDPALRERAAKALGRIGHPDALAPLLGTLAAAPSVTLRVAAATALGDTGSATVVPELIALLSQPDAEVARAAALSLTRLGETGLAALTDLTYSDPAPEGTLVVVEPGRYAAGPPSGLGGARAGAALAALHRAPARVGASARSELARPHQERAEVHR